MPYLYLGLGERNQTDYDQDQIKDVFMGEVRLQDVSETSSNYRDTKYYYKFN